MMASEGDTSLPKKKGKPSFYGTSHETTTLKDGYKI